ncbi:hypothetical protein C0991_007616 [Blastosporella zonata]|nr:hypothetical protein C0991_007616 [Blastosporella zonata]
MFKACWAQSSRAIASSSSQSSSLHTSAVLHAQKSRHDVARGIKKLNVARKEERWLKNEATRPSIIIGTRPGEGEKWDRCLLSKILVDMKDLVSSTELLPTQQSVGTVYLPKQMNFGIGEAEKKLLFDALPVITSSGNDFSAVREQAKQEGAEEQPTDTYVSVDGLTAKQKIWKANLELENQKANAFAKLVDLRNANADGIAYENRKRIIAAFSTPKNPHDPGRPEVQAALLTYKIRNLWTHLTTFKRDVGNIRGLRMLVHQRAKILKYLKKVDQSRYEIVLEQLALEPESVEGELVV